LTWQDDTQTLLGEDIDANIEQLKGLLEKELKVTFRA
jgi:phenylalanyl-tRNA synthetase beta subunit